MADASGKTVLEIGGRDVIFRQLKVGELRAVLEQRSEYDTLHHELFPDMAMTEIPAFTNLQLADLEGFEPTEVAEVIEKIKERNSHFFVMLARLTKASQALVKA